MLPSTPTQPDRIRGALLGLAWGDVLGCPVEGWDARHIRRVYGVYADLPLAYSRQQLAGASAKALRRLRPLGLHSDDTQQALALLNVCLSPGGWSAAKWAACLVEGMRAGAWRGYRPELQRRRGTSGARRSAATRRQPHGRHRRSHAERAARRALPGRSRRAGIRRHGVQPDHPRRHPGRGHRLCGRLCRGRVRGRPAGRNDRRRAPRRRRGRRGGLAGRTSGVGTRPVRRSRRLAGAGGRCWPTWRRRSTCLRVAHLRDRVAQSGSPASPARIPTRAMRCWAAATRWPWRCGPTCEPQAALAEIVQQGYDTDTVAAIAGSLLGARFG